MTVASLLRGHSPIALALSVLSAGSAHPQGASLCANPAPRVLAPSRDAGGLLAAGVDPTGFGGALPGYGDQRNYELFIEAGFTPAQAVQIMTGNGAKILGSYDRFGSIERGKSADLVVLNGDLVADPSTIRKVTTVFRDGVGYDSPK